MKIFLIRHGETTGDVEDRYGGWYDDDLTSKGEQQLAETAEKLVGKDIEIIFCSPLIRAKHSAQIIKNKIAVEVEFLPELKERNYGILGGLKKAEAKEKFPEAVRTYSDPKITAPEGESYEEFSTRVASGFTKITKSSKRVVAIVSHGGPIKLILKMLGKEVPEKIGDGEIIEIDI